MKTYTYETHTQVSALILYSAITDIAHWPDWDKELERTEHTTGLQAGARFMLKPKGGPKVNMEIVEAVRPSSFVDIAHLPFAKMRTSHSFSEARGQTSVTIKIEVWGILGFLWDRVVARKQAAGAEEQTRRFIAFSEGRR